VLGYLFQCRYALLGSLRKLRMNQEFTVSMETLDDVVFEQEGKPLELLQTKHHCNKEADLTDASPDLWKSIRIWCKEMKEGKIPEGSTFFLITTAQASTGSAAHYLKADASRNTAKAIERLNATATTSTSQTNKLAYEAFCSLDPDRRTKLVNSAIVIDRTPLITDLDKIIRQEVCWFVRPKFRDSYLQRLEGWWFQKAIKHLARKDSEFILSEDLLEEAYYLQEQFKQDSLPIDDEIMEEAVADSDYQDMVFVHQLHLIEIGNPRIFYAIRNYFRAFEHRSRWVREDLLIVSDLDRYENRLVEEWDLLYQRMLEKLGKNAGREALIGLSFVIWKSQEFLQAPDMID